MSKCRGPAITTRMGRLFYPLDPRPDEVHIHDIAYSLSMKCRFGGFCEWYYSVATHAVVVAEQMAANDSPFAFCGLMHDAAEAYLPDVPRPLKKQLPGFEEMERRVLGAIATRFNLPQTFAELPAVIEVDDRVLVGEARRMMSGDVREFPNVPPAQFDCLVLTPEQSRVRFLNMFHMLYPNG